MHRREFLACCGALLGGAVTARSESSPDKPKIRAITAFIALDPSRYQEQIQQTLQMLRQAKRSIEAGGYDVQSLRIVTQPFPQYTSALTRDRALRFFHEYDALAVKESFDPNIGPAMARDGDDPSSASLLGEILSTTKTIEGSIIIASPGSGIHWHAVRAAAGLVKFVEEHSPGSIGNFNFAVTAMLQPYGPFYPGAYHLGAGHSFSIGTQGANVVDRVFGETAGDVPRASQRLTEVLADHAGTLERLARQVEKESGWTYMGLDATPAPLREVSIGAAIEKFIAGPFGSNGTMSAASIITKAVQLAPVKRIGYSGLMLPVMEDSLLARRWGERTYTMDSLLAYSAVCGTGLDTIPMAGDVPQLQIERIFSDVASLACKWNKPLSARLLPVKNKKPRDRTQFDDPFLVNTVIQPLR